MASMNKASRTIFVGNISHEGSDEEIGALMNQIGPTVSMRIMKDRDTGRRKGFAFIEYQDADTAMNALRSLAEYDFHGRPLRVSLAQEENKPTSQRGTPPVSAGAQTRTAVSDPVAAVVNATPSIQLFDLLQRTRDFVAQQPQQAQALLISQPPLCYALSLGLDRLLGNLVDVTETSKLSSAAESTPMEVSSPAAAAGAADAADAAAATGPTASSRRSEARRRWGRPEAWRRRRRRPEDDAERCAIANATDAAAIRPATATGDAAAVRPAAAANAAAVRPATAADAAAIWPAAGLGHAHAAARAAIISAVASASTGATIRQLAQGAAVILGTRAARPVGPGRTRSSGAAQTAGHAGAAGAGTTQHAETASARLGPRAARPTRARGTRTSGTAEKGVCCMSPCRLQQKLAVRRNDNIWSSRNSYSRGGDPLL